MKKISTSVLSLLLISSMSNLASASSNVVIQNANYPIVINGQERHYEQSPVTYNDFTLIPLRGVFEDIGAEVKYDAATKKITINRNTESVTIAVGSNTAFISGKPVTLEIPPQIINERALVPLRFVSESLGSTVVWDSKSKTIQINTSEKSMQTHQSSTGNIESKNGTGTTLTYQEAVDKAYIASLKLKEAKAEVNRADDAQENASSNIYYTPVGNGNGDSDNQARGAIKGSISAQIAKDKAEKQVGMTKDSIAYQVKKAYFLIQQKQKNKEIADLTAEESLMKKNITDLKVEQGLASEFDQLQAKNTYISAVENQNVSEKELKDAFLKFNQLIGASQDSTYNLVDDPIFEPQEEVNLDYYVQKTIEDNPSIWMLGKQVELAQINLDLYSFNTGGADSYKAKEIDVDKAQLTLADSKKQLEESLRSMYNSMKQLENQYASLQANLAKAEGNLKLLQTKFDLGMVTAVDVFESKLSVEQLKKQVFDIAVNMELLKIGFEKPWAITG